MGHRDLCAIGCKELVNLPARQVKCCSFIVTNTLYESKPGAIAKGVGLSLEFERSNLLKQIQ